jgi:glutamate formiminotransferase
MALAVPNYSEGREQSTIASIADAFAAATILDRHSDPAHNRTVLWLSAPAEGLVVALADGARACRERIDITVQTGEHPRIGALDVCPAVWLDQDARPEARELALAAASAIGDLGVPVFLYGELASDPSRVERAFFRRGRSGQLAERMR